MDENKLRALLRNLEQAAQSALANDASFLEALQGLKWEVDRDAHVRAAIQALRNRGLIVFSSFAPRIRVRLRSGEEVMALLDDIRTSDRPGAEDVEYANQVGSEPLSQGVRDAASAVVGASLYCRELNRIVNEALHASAGFEKMAGPLERAGFELHICLDLSTYACVRPQTRQGAQPIDRGASATKRQQRKSQSAGKRSQLPLSGQDIEFLKSLRIRPQ